jgi:hypothetical protein
MLRNQISDGYDSNHTAPVNQRLIARHSWRKIPIALIVLSLSGLFSSVDQNREELM